MCVTRGWGGRGRMPCWEIWNISGGGDTVRTDLGLSQCPQMCWWTNSLCPVVLLYLLYLGDSLVGAKCQSQMYASTLRDPFPPHHSLTHKSWHLLTPLLGRTVRDSQVRMGMKFCLCFSKRCGVSYLCALGPESLHALALGR